MKYLICIAVLMNIYSLYAQKTLEGYVQDNNGTPLPGANIFIKGTYDGTITNEDGHFSLQSNSSSDSLLIISYIGYQQREIPVEEISTALIIKLTEISNKLDEIRISAGAFEASEENRAVLLSPVDIATTASSDADIYGALSTFPGARKLGESGELIVRGGEADETKTYIDGMLVSSPYGSRLPDLPSRGRFTPFMFNGVMFSTGGYSAEYGQALSSVLELQTPGIFSENMTSITLFNVGAGMSHTRQNTHSAFSGEVFYANTYPYFGMASHDLDWIKIPQSLEGKAYHRKKTGQTGMLKTDAILSYTSSELDYSTTDIGYNIIGLHNDNEFIKSTFNTELNEKCMLKSGIAYNRNVELISLDRDELRKYLGTMHLKLSLVNCINDDVTVKTGIDANNMNYQFQFSIDSSNEEIKLDVQDWIFAGFLESDIRIFKQLAIRAGARSEYSTYTNCYNIAPRTSMAYKLGKTSQVSFSMGQFYQQNHHDYLKYTDHLNFESARHLLINYQFQNEGRIFRTEFYHKKYTNLITYIQGDDAEYDNLANNGYGYARGIDIFWKDDATLRNTSYWISYSYIDSEREYKDYPDKAVPDFVSPHNLSLVYKYWWEAKTTQFALTYSFASGRTYYNPNNHNFMTDRTPSIHDVSVSISYITELFGNFTVVHASVSNILGQEYIYSYRYSENPDSEGYYSSSPVTNPIQRTIILGISVSIN